jgi:methylenetetrahydrofolate dehydrogenase (NADP+)/methenyltetrahydrofolate cyclohydrolase
MPAQVIDGKQIAQTIREEIKVKTQEFINRTGIQPGLATILVGQDPASQVYVRNKHRGCAEVGFYSEKHELPETTTVEELVALVQKLNKDPKIHGILVQLPLPKHIPESVAIDAIDPEKDVDGIHPNNIGNLVLGKKSFVACTPAGVMRLIDTTGIELKGKHAVVVGRSNIVGKPLSLLLLARHATVTICHSRTQDLGAVTRTADVLCVAVGKAKLIKGDMVKPGAVVIDIGTNRNEEGKLVGDVDFESVLPVAKAITPVPKGVGPMTITMLLWNTLESAEKFAAKK